MPSSTTTVLPAAASGLEVDEGSDLQRYRLAGLLVLAVFTASFWTALIAALMWLADAPLSIRTGAAVALSIAGAVLLFGAPFFTDRAHEEGPAGEQEKRSGNGRGEED